ncbi:hypothetical protein [Streptomyces sp. NPDC001389]|uniref:hypothetical protein n=1 Tax=Streptomyces sp. NPDC001389 TaxID=3364569 RepID=UPI003686FAED
METPTALVIGQLTDYLRGLTQRLDPGTGWYGEFLRRDPEGMRACLAGIALPPWDVLESLLLDLPGGPGEAAREAAHAADLRAAAVTAWDARPGGARELGILLAAATEQRVAMEEALRYLSARLGGATDPAEEEALSRELAWTRDDATRAAARQTDLESRLSSLSLPAVPRQRDPAGPLPPADPVGSPAGRPHPRAGRPEPPIGRAEGRWLRGARRAGEARYAGPAPAHAAPTAPLRALRGARFGRTATPPTPSAVMPSAPPGATPPTHSAGMPPTPSAVMPSAPPAAMPPTSPAAMPSAPPAVTPPTPPAVTPPAPPVAPAPEPVAVLAGRRADIPAGGPAGAFAGGPADTSAGRPGGAPARRPPDPAGGPRTDRSPADSGKASGDTLPAEASGTVPRGVARAAFVAELLTLRTRGHSGEAHALLCEAALWPAGELPGLAEELGHAGLAADWATLLWETASLPPDRLAAAAGALGEAGREADADRLLRQGVARPAAEVAEAALALGAAGRDRETGSLLQAFVRLRTADETAALARHDPHWFTPRLLRAARALSAARHRDLSHALRVAGLPAN